MNLFSFIAFIAYTFAFLKPYNERVLDSQICTEIIYEFVLIKINIKLT